MIQNRLINAIRLLATINIHDDPTAAESLYLELVRLTTAVAKLTGEDYETLLRNEASADVADLMVIGHKSVS